MQLGIFAKTFSRPDVEATLDAVKAQGLNCLQFNFACAGLPTLPSSIQPALARRIGTELRARSLSMVAISGTCNLIHPDEKLRAEHLQRLLILIEACRDLGTHIVTLCSGTRDPEDMWRGHQNNVSSEAWRDLIDSLAILIPKAEQHAIVLGIEPEPANVVDCAASAAKLLREIKSPVLKIVFDAANLLAGRQISDQHKILSEAFERIGPNIVLAHAKDLARCETNQDDTFYKTVPAGKGQLDYGFYLSTLNKSGFKGPLILHSLSEEQVPSAVEFLTQTLERNSK